MKANTPDGLIVFAAWTVPGGGLEFDRFIQMGESTPLQHRAFLKQAWMAINEYMDTMNKDMINSGEAEIVIDLDMVEWRRSMWSN